MRFISRCLGHQPSVEISGVSVEHILTSRYFTTYTYDGKFKVIVTEDDVVKITVADANTGGFNSMVIGWIKRE